jgi:hypothetical protein
MGDDGNVLLRRQVSDVIIHGKIVDHEDSVRNRMVFTLHGYIENCLPYTMAKLGHEVYIVTSLAQVYYNEDFSMKLHNT